MIGGKRSLQVPTESCYPALEMLPDEDVELRGLDEEQLPEDLQMFSDDDDQHIRQQNIPFWGFEMLERLRVLNINPNQFQHISRSKLLLDESAGTEVVRTELTPVLERLKERKAIRRNEDVIADYLTQLFRHTKHELETTHEISDTRSVEHVLCVPNVWSSKANRRMQAAVGTAIRNSGLGTPHNMFLVAEPEAAAAYVLESNNQIKVRKS